MSHDERRRYPRIHDEALALQVNLGDYDAMTHTLNISASGIYCKLDKEIPLMSRVKLMLMMPEPSGRTKKLTIDGVVVREHPVIIDGKIKHYDAAIFFDTLTPKDRDTIALYVSRKTPSPA